MAVSGRFRDEGYGASEKVRSNNEGKNKKKKTKKQKEERKKEK